MSVYLWVSATYEGTVKTLSGFSMEQISRLNGMLNITIAYTTSESKMLRPPVVNFADLQVGTVISNAFLAMLTLLA